MVPLDQIPQEDGIRDGQFQHDLTRPDFPQKVACLVMGIPGYFREIQIGEILFHLAR